MSKKPFVIVRKPVGIACPACAKNNKRGTMSRVTLSRLEEGLGHEGFECYTCGHRMKYVPKEAA